MGKKEEERGGEWVEGAERERAGGEVVGQVMTVSAEEISHHLLPGLHRLHHLRLCIVRGMTGDISAFP